MNTSIATTIPSYTAFFEGALIIVLPLMIFFAGAYVAASELGSHSPQPVSPVMYAQSK